MAGHDHSRHGHAHGVVDPALATTRDGIRAIAWSFAILALTAAAQLVVALASGSVALLGDTIHNVGDATTAVPLFVAFVLARRKPSRTFTYGLGRVEDLAGLAIVLLILASAVVTGYQSVDRLLHPRAVNGVGWVVAAGLVGFAGNELVAGLRIRVGRRIDSAALVADGYHARSDGLASLAVVAGAAGVALGFPLADPLVGIGMTLLILAIVAQSARAVVTRLLDGVEPAVLDEVLHAAGHVPGLSVVDARARWLGHRLYVDLGVTPAASASVAELGETVALLRRELAAHVPALGGVQIEIAPGRRT